jgi:hypothetical protein
MHMKVVVLGCMMMLVSASDPQIDLEELLMEDEECSADDEECAVSALQKRATKLQAVDDASVEVDLGQAGNSSSCVLGAVEMVMQQEAADCVKACPQLCQASTVLLAAATQDELYGGICQDSRLTCALQEENAEACRPLLQLLEESNRKVPLTLEDYKAACSGEAGTGSSVGANLVQVLGKASLLKALVARASAGDADATQEVVERSVAGKTANAFCAKAGEGQKCIPNQHGGHSDSWIYCSAGKMLSAGVTQCSQKRGRMSWCDQNNYVGLARQGCDDPFCRNGGAFGGNGRYCHNGHIVLCQGQNKPRIIDSCSDQTHQDYDGCTITDHYTCGGNFPHPHCVFSSSSRSCNGNNGGSAYR